jgi:hypothetical protein
VLATWAELAGWQFVAIHLSDLLTHKFPHQQSHETQAPSNENKRRKVGKISMTLDFFVGQI